MDDVFYDDPKVGGPDLAKLERIQEAPGAGTAVDSE